MRYLPHSASSETVGDIDGLVQVCRHQTGSESVHRLVGAFDQFIQVLELQDLLYRPENLHNKAKDPTIYVLDIKSAAHSSISTSNTVPAPGFHLSTPNFNLSPF